MNQSLQSDQAEDIVGDVARHEAQSDRIPDSFIASIAPHESLDIEAPGLSVRDAQALSGRATSQIADAMEDASNSNGVKAVQNVFFTDLTGSSNLKPRGIPDANVRVHASPTPSDSSEEVILFTGRKATQSSNLQSSAQNQSIRRQTSGHAGDVRAGHISTIRDDPALPSRAMTASSPMITSHNRSRDAQTLDPLKMNSSDVSASKSGFLSSEDHKRNFSPNARLGSVDVLADYIANVREYDKFHDTVGSDVIVNRRELGGMDVDRSDADRDFVQPPHDDHGLLTFEEGWDSADLVDFDGLSTSSESVDHVQIIRSKRVRPLGLQYLVVPNGSSTDFARWVPVQNLQSANAIEQIRLFEESQPIDSFAFGESGSVSEESSGGDMVNMDMQDDLDSVEDERDLSERRKAQMTDEQLARLLSKQEELGLGSDDLIIFDDEDQSGNVSKEAQCGEFGRRSLSLRSLAKAARKKHDSATALADVLDEDPYGGFDVMDRERDSVRRTTTARRNKLVFDLSDSELEFSMSRAWEHDRNKKKLRKQEREEIRAQGHLNHKGKIDLKAKYSEGMSIDEVKNEIRDFLMSTAERYSNCSSILSATMLIMKSSTAPNEQTRSKGRSRDCPCLQIEV